MWVVRVAISMRRRRFTVRVIITRGSPIRRIIRRVRCRGVVKHITRVSIRLVRRATRTEVARHRHRPTTRRIVKTARRIVVHRVTAPIRGRVVGQWQPPPPPPPEPEPPTTVACGRSACTESVSSSKQHKSNPCAAGHTYWTCNPTVNVANWLNKHRVRTCRYSECGRSWQQCVTGTTPICNKPYRKQNGLKCWAIGL